MSCSSSTSTRAPEFPCIESLMDTLQCPVGLDPLIEAVTLTPCCHKVNNGIAEKIYGNMARGACEKAEIPCVTCRTPVQGYYPDHFVRNIVQQVLEIVPRIQAIEETEPPKKSRFLEKNYADELFSRIREIDIARLTKALQCHVGSDPLTRAVTLLPCCHKVNQAAAEGEYGNMARGSCQKAGRLCVICTTPVQAYYPDHSVRDIAQRLLEFVARIVKLYQRAADGGNIQAMVNLGVMYAHGRGGLPQDDAQAVRLYQRAAEGMGLQMHWST